MLEEQQKFLADGMDGILTKPIARDALRDLLRNTAEGTSMPMISQDHSAETRQALGEDAFAKLLSRFVTEVQELQTWLGTEEAQDYLEIAGRAHKVAGSAAVFGATPLRETLKSIENAAKAGDNAAINAGIAQLGAIWTQTKTELK